MFPYRNGVASHWCLPHGRNAKISRGLRGDRALKPRLLILALRPWGKHPHGTVMEHVFHFVTDVREKARLTRSSRAHLLSGASLGSGRDAQEGHRRT